MIENETRRTGRMTLTRTPRNDTNLPLPPSTIHGFAGPGSCQYLNPECSPVGPPPAATTTDRMMMPSSMDSLSDEKPNSASPELPSGR